MALTIAFLGCGAATRLHGKTLAQLKRDVRCFYASRDRAKAIAYNAEFKGGGYFESYEAAIRAPEIDVVVVATPPASHLELTLAALRGGKQVIVEKPPFLRSTDFTAVREAQTETGGRVLVAENYFYKPLAVDLRRLIAADLIGEVLFVHVNALKKQKTGDWRDEASLAGGGAMFEGGIHWINLIANLGLSVKSVRGLRPGSAKGMEKSMLVAIEYASGAVGTLYYSWEVSTLLQGLHLSRIYGREGVITFESNGLFILVNGRKRRLILPKLTDIAGRKSMFRDFIRVFQSGIEPQMTLEVAQRDLEFIEAIYQSADAARAEC